MERLKAYMIAIVLDVLPIVLGALVLYSALAVFVSAHAYTGTAYLVGELDIDYNTKACVYERLGNRYVVTQSKLKWCAPTIQVEV